MNNLRARLERLIVHTESLHAELPDPHGPMTEGYGMAIRDVKAILAACPDNTTMEWGVRANWGGVSRHKSEGSARTAVAPGLYELVNRQSATEWQAAK